MKQSVYILACMAFACMFNSCGGNKFISSSGLHSAHFQQKVNGEKPACIGSTTKMVLKHVLPTMVHG